eukprot:1677383-Prymnesium_polylepis.1
MLLASFTVPSRESLMLGMTSRSSRTGAGAARPRRAPASHEPRLQRLQRREQRRCCPSSAGSGTTSADDGNGNTSSQSIGSTLGS